jgi:hypothetical protein
MPYAAENPSASFLALKRNALGHPGLADYCRVPTYQIDYGLGSQRAQRGIDYTSAKGSMMLPVPQVSLIPGMLLTMKQTRSSRCTCAVAHTTGPLLSCTHNDEKGNAAISTKD